MKITYDHTAEVLGHGAGGTIVCFTGTTTSGLLFTSDLKSSDLLNINHPRGNERREIEYRERRYFF